MDQPSKTLDAAQKLLPRDPSEQQSLGWDYVFRYPAAFSPSQVVIDTAVFCFPPGSSEEAFTNVVWFTEL